MTEDDVMAKASEMRAERLNATGRAAIDMWEALMLEFAATDHGRPQRATLAGAAERAMRAAMAADKLQDAENMDRLLQYQDRKAEASTRARRLTVLDGGG